jgi:hypothetical protein
VGQLARRTQTPRQSTAQKKAGAAEALAFHRDPAIKCKSFFELL